MIRQFTCVLVAALTATSIYAQPLKWQKTLGGTENDLLLSSESTNDGGYIFAGYSASPAGLYKSENAIGNNDMWIVKTDSVGNIEWENTIGGLADDVANSISQTLDGGYIVAGYSGSGISGDKTEATKGGLDYWIVKLDALGNIEWQNTIGGNKNDQAVAVKQALDLGYIVAGFSLSGISGDKSEVNNGPSTTSDYWIIKLDNAGNIVWQNTIGGNSYDYLYTVELTWDGGYVVGGYSQSGISGDKTEALIGSADYWVLKLNHLGNIQWQNTIGGSGSDIVRKIIQDDDGGFIVGGYSSSDISGDKSEIAYGVSTDYWVVKLNSSGMLVWQNNVGGNDTEILYDIVKLQEGGFGLFGVTYSGVSGDKTEAGKGGGDYWYVKLNDAGELESQNTVGGILEDGVGSITQGSNGDIILAGYSKSPLGEDKTENNLGALDTYDWWIVAFGAACTPSVEICNTVDDDCNGLIDDAIIESITIATTGPTTVCQGESVTFNATYTGTNLQWKLNGNAIAGATSSSYTTTQKGLYTCYTESFCGSAESAGINVVVNKKPAAAITPAGPTSFCAGGNVTLNVTPVGGCSYQWYKGASLIAGATGLSYIASTPGNYKCQVTKIATGCFKNSNTIAVFVPCKEGEELFTSNWTIAPNPASNQIIINNLSELSSEINTINILNAIGEIVIAETNENNQQMIIDISKLPNGLYFVKLNGEKSIQTFIKQ